MVRRAASFAGPPTEPASRPDDALASFFRPQTARTCPVLFVNSETFQWKENLDAITAWVDADSSSGSAAGGSSSSSSSASSDPMASATPTTHDGLVVTLLQTAHQNQSDFPLLLPTILRAVKMAGPLAPTTAIHLNNRAMLSFLHKHVPHCMVRACGPRHSRSGDAAPNVD